MKQGASDMPGPDGCSTGARAGHSMGAMTIMAAAARRLMPATLVRKLAVTTRAAA